MYVQGVEEDLKADPPCHPAAVSTAPQVSSHHTDASGQCAIQGTPNPDLSPHSTAAIPVLKALKTASKSTHLRKESAKARSMRSMNAAICSTNDMARMRRRSVARRPIFLG